MRAGLFCGAVFRADAKKRYSDLWVRELRAGGMLRLAGFSSGRRDCARGAVLRSGFIAAAGSVAGMDVFSPNSRKVRQPGLPVGESAVHWRTDEGVSRDAACMPREKTLGAT